MSVVLNEVRRATYFDSIVLMRISRQIAALPGVEEAGLMIATPANKDILREAGILGEAGDPGRQPQRWRGTNLSAEGRDPFPRGGGIVVGDVVHAGAVVDRRDR